MFDLIDIMDLIRIIRNGAYLADHRAEGAMSLLAPVAEIDNGRLLYYDITLDRARALPFEAEEWPHIHGCWLIDRGERAVYITSVDEDPDTEAAWASVWVNQPQEERDRLLAFYQEQIAELKGE